MVQLVRNVLIRIIMDILDIIVKVVQLLIV